VDVVPGAANTAMALRNCCTSGSAAAARPDEARRRALPEEEREAEDDLAAGQAKPAEAVFARLLEKYAAAP